MGLVVAAIFTPIELFITLERQSLRGRLKGLAFWGLWLIAGIATAIVLQPLMPTALFRLPIFLSWSPVLDLLVAPVLAAMIGDGIFYFHHRIQHAVPLLWRFHAVHHSIRELNAVNSYHHPLDDLIKGLISIVPLSLIAVDAPRAVPVLAMILGMHSFYLHSPIKTDLGPLRIIFGDNRFHRIHHSMDPQHYGKNYGALTTLWDQLFGTAYFPGKNEWPEVGLDDVPQPRSVREWLLQPFRRPQRPAPELAVAE